MKSTYGRGRGWLAVAIIWVGTVLGGAPNAFAQPEENGSSEELERIIDAIRDAHSEATQALKDLPRGRFESRPALEAADYDFELIVEWVENNIQWVPYPGMLRGVHGVLLDQRGNSLDRSLLLANLLADAGYEVRLVRGRLSPEAVEAVLSSNSVARLEPQEDKTLFPEEVVTAAGQASGQASDLATLIGDLPESDSITSGEIADHWWVEAQPDNEWITVDLLLSGPLAAMRPEPLERISSDSLPESLSHRVTIRVVIERWDDGQTSESIPLEHTVNAPEAVYHDLELLFAPFHFDPQPDDSDADQQAQAIAQTTEEWLPVLRIGTKDILNQGFDQEGNLEVSPGRIAAARKAEAATSALQTLGTTENEPPKTHLSALWIEYQVDVPGREPRIERREIFDLVGPARRRNETVEAFAMDSSAVRERGIALMGTHRILITSAAPPQIALEKAAWEFWADHGPQIAGLLRLVYNPDDDEAAGRANRDPLKALDLLGLATARHVLSPHRSAVYLASPNILSSHFIANLDGSYQVQKAFDIVINDVGVVPNSTIAASRVRLEQGVLDTILEAAMMGTKARFGNTADLFASREEKPSGWQRVVESTDVSALPETARARIAEALEAGQIVVAPAGLGPGDEAAWWEVDPSTGTTLGIGHNGWGVVAEQTVRGIATGGVTHGARRYGMMTYCKAAVAFLTAGGWIFTGLGGTVVYTYQAVEFLIARGCSIVI